MTTNDKLGQSIDAKRQRRGKQDWLANKRKDLPPDFLQKPRFRVDTGSRRDYDGATSDGGTGRIPARHAWKGFL